MTGPGGCSSRHPAFGVQCQRPANGHEEHEAASGDSTATWRTVATISYTPEPGPRIMPPLPPIVTKDQLEGEK